MQHHFLYISLFIFNITQIFGQLENIDKNKLKQVELSKNPFTYCFSVDSNFYYCSGYYTCVSAIFREASFFQDDSLLYLAGKISDCFDSSKIVKNSQIILGEFIQGTFLFEGDTLYNRDFLELSVTDTEKALHKGRMHGAKLIIREIFDVDDFGNFKIKFIPKEKDSICITFKIIDNEIEYGGAQIFQIYKLY